MNYLSLFTGAGGGDLAMQHLLGFRCVGYVEIENYCQRLIRQRITDGFLDAAPVFGDIRKFISDGYAEQYQGMVDLVTGGFPCQPFSSAGQQQAENDTRNMWPSTLDCIRQIHPHRIFCENVAGLLAVGYFPRILADLAGIGFDVEWGVLSASDCGSIHQRKRVWIMAHPAGVDDARCNTKENGWTVEQCSQLGGPLWRPPRPEPCRMDDGLANGLDRLRATGNGQVPIVAATAFRILAGEMTGG